MRGYEGADGMSRYEAAYEAGYNEETEAVSRWKKQNAWRTVLDSRDPDYLDDTEEEDDE